MAAVVAGVKAVAGLVGAFVGWVQAVNIAFPVVATIARVALAAGSYAYARAQSKKAARALASFDSSRGVSIREPAAPRRILYGQMRMGGTIVFADTSGTNNEFLHLVIAHCEGPIEEIGDVYLNDEIVPLDGSGNATGKYAGYVTVIKHLGSTSQTVDTALQTAVGSGTWSNNHRLRGIAYSYLRLKHNPDLFPSGLPNYSAILKGRNDIYDPRDASTSYKTNSALCLRHYLLLAASDGGLGAASSEIDDTAVQTAANICDESVNLNPSGTESRYTCNGIVDTSNEPGAIIDGICSSMAGICPYVGGKFKMKAGAHTSSVFSFNEDDMIGRVQFATRDSMRVAFNGVKGTYVTADNDYQVSDFPPVVNSTYTTEDGGYRIWKDIALAFTTSSATAQRLAKIELERGRQDIVVNIETKLGAIDAHVGDVVDLTLARYGWTSKLFEVTNCAFVVSEGGGGPTLGLRWTLRETASAVWDWNSGEETVVDVAPNTDLPDLFTVATLSGLTANNAGFIQGDGTWQPRVLASWTQATDTYVLNGGKVAIEYKVSTSTTWNVFDGPIRGDATEVYLTDVIAGAATNIRGRFENVRFVRGAYATAITVTITGDTTAPNAPASGSFTAATSDSIPPRFFDGGGLGIIQYLACRVQWAASTSKDTAFYEWVATDLWVTAGHSATDYDGAWGDYSTALKQAQTTADISAFHYGIVVSAYNVAVRAVDFSGNRSGWFAIGDPRSSMSRPAGSMAVQAASGVAISGGTISSVTISSVTISSVSSMTVARAAFGLGNISTQSSASVSITGGSIAIPTLTVSGSTVAIQHTADAAVKIGEDWGWKIGGSSDHPVRFVGCSIAMGDIDSDGTDLGTGRIYGASGRYIYWNSGDGKFHAVDDAGDHAL